jgi:hypothetical protein
MKLFSKSMFKGELEIKARRVQHVYALIPNVAVLWFKRDAMNMTGIERGLHLEWLSGTLTISFSRITFEDEQGEV